MNNYVSFFFFSIIHRYVRKIYIYNYWKIINLKVNLIFFLKHYFAINRSTNQWPGFFIRLLNLLRSI